MSHDAFHPAHPGYFADPFVWCHDGAYYAIATNIVEDRGEVDLAGESCIFPLLRSDDFAHWEYAGQAMDRPDAALGDTFWAPEIAYDGGVFYLYYSVGREDKGHHIRVATSERPLGPYRDQGVALTDRAACPFAIDPHPFRDSDGRWYLFYARDFLDADGGTRAGTALVADRLVDMTALAGRETTILRARSDWQRFLAGRPMYGGVYDWHTLEGPFVRWHDGLYYCFYSGGRWEADNYGVDYAVSRSVLGPYSDAGNEAGARVLRTVPGRLLGPGHNSVVAGPDGDDYIAFHAWDADRRARQMHLDRLLWTPSGPHGGAMAVAYG